ncbi:hypothetical protein ACFHYQ_04085 [Sphaerimonospora cavernae]|uniref:Uncharacterized protein n=1 Tax=Sphaerimonospora cavernae TaxID=1740611 RepID=A0ABV6U0F0_9ACTN
MDRFVHVIPLDDVISHEGTPHCVCGPGGEPVTATDLDDSDNMGLGWSSPTIGVIYRHYSLTPCRQWEAVPEV